VLFALKTIEHGRDDRLAAVQAATIEQRGRA
jgi:hypothetical protein